MNSDSSQVSVATKHCIHPISIPTINIYQKSSDFNAANVPIVEVENGIYISDLKPQCIPSYLLKRTQNSAPEVLWADSKDLKRL